MLLSGYLPGRHFSIKQDAQKARSRPVAPAAARMQERVFDILSGEAGPFASSLKVSLANLLCHDGTVYSPDAAVVHDVCRTAARQVDLAVSGCTVLIS
jgi:hypothetical protein